MKKLIGDYEGIKVFWDDGIDFFHVRVTLPAEFFCGQCSFNPIVSTIDFLDIRVKIKIESSIIEKWRCEDAKRKI